MDKQKLDALRKRAETILGSESDDFSGSSGDELRSALHELHTHQIELELQNEELRQVQEELVESRDHYIDLYDFAPVGYLTLSDNNLIVEANLTLADPLGVERKSLLGRPFSQFIDYEDQDVFYKHFRGCPVPANRSSCELRMRKKDCDWFWAKLECVFRAKKHKKGDFPTS
jgi:PAS domain S-box-containing protein